jgi:glutathione-regulated potassium-efflux system ancillary protein KefC
MLWLIARPLGVPRAQRRWFAVLLGQGSEFAFVSRAWPLDDFSRRVNSTSRMGVAAIDSATARVSAGRFGQIAGRLLLSSGVKMVILDHDPDHVDTLRKFSTSAFSAPADSSRSTRVASP